MPLTDWRLPTDKIPSVAILLFMVPIGISGARSSAQGDPPGKTPDDLVAATEDPSGLAYSEEAIVDKYTEIYGEAAAAELTSSGVGLVEILSPPGDIAGLHDTNTIGINTKTPDGDTKLTLTQAAITVRHELKHVKSAAAAGKTFDPTTMGPLGGCAHAAIHAETAIETMDGTAGSGYPGVDVCAIIHSAIVMAKFWEGKCKKAGGTSPGPTAYEANEVYLDVCSL